MDIRKKTRRLLKMIVNSPSKVTDSKNLVEFGENSINGAFDELLKELDQYMSKDKKNAFMDYMTESWDLVESLSENLVEFVSDYSLEPQVIFEALNHYWSTDEKEEFMDHVQLLMDIE